MKKYKIKIQELPMLRLDKLGSEFEVTINDHIEYESDVFIDDQRYVIYLTKPTRPFMRLVKDFSKPELHFNLTDFTIEKVRMGDFWENISHHQFTSMLNKKI